jgi:hypothetical protein
MWWLRHAFRQYLLGEPEGALTSVHQARQLEPNSWTGVDLELVLLDLLSDDESREALMPLGCALGVPQCE